MRITLTEILIRELVEGYVDNDEEGVFGYGGKLNIRPKYQREFVYKEKERNAVIDSICRNYPLNVMYWMRQPNGTYELLDGQQRTVSICQYHENDFSIEMKGNPKLFTSLTQEQQRQFLDYPLQVYICENGTEEERIEWFQRINIAGVELTQQEIRNAVYTGPWVTSAKKRFSKTACVAYQMGGKYLSGEANRQAYLETIIRWCAEKDNVGSVEQYMSLHQHDENSDREWQYFQQVITWVQSLFPKYRKEMKGLEWGMLYNRFKGHDYLATQLEKRVSQLMEDDDVTKKSGIYEYVLSGDERRLNIRTFSTQMKRSAYERQQGFCVKCGHHFEFEQMQGDHITPWNKGGKTVPENCQMLCQHCNATKGDN